MNEPRAVVIGSGFGGLALAIRLQTAGIATTVLERRDLPGGRAYVYRQDGFTFDAGPTVITAPEALRELFTGAGRDLDDFVELLPVSPFYRLMWEDGYQFDYSGDLEATNRQIAARSPGDVAGYARFLEYMEQGRSDLLRDVGLPYPEIEEMGYFLPVVEAHARYVKAARYDESLRVKTFVREMPQARIRIEYEVTNDLTKELLLEGYTIHSFVNASTGRPTRAPERFLEALEKAMRRP